MAETAPYRRYAELEAGLAEIERSPRERGVLDLIVRRPARGEREVLTIAELNIDEGLVGDRWAQGKRHRENQVTLMSSRVAALLAADRERWSLAGDQLYVDLDLSAEHLPAGTRVAIGAAEVEVSPEPHMGCRLFRERFGPEAERFVNSAVGRALQLRGINAWVVKGGEIRQGDVVRVLFE
jgi:MOSC domain-containing protein YiiM